MKKIKKIILIFILLLLSSCAADTPQDVTDLIVQPETEDPILKGTWEVKDIKTTGKNFDQSSIKKGDLLFIDKKLVAINKDYAYPPKFTSKYVELNKYLESRGIDLKVSTNTNVKVINASQGQLYSKDFVVLSDKNIFFINDSNIILLKKISTDIDRKIFKKYQANSDSERSLTIEGEAVEVDTNIYIGVRERVENLGNNPSYNYYTYSVRIQPNKPARVYKTDDIYFPMKDEFWRFKSLKNDETGKYDSFLSYPVRLENKMDNENIKEKYTFKDIDKDMRFNFVNEKFISFDYNIKTDKISVGKYAIVKTDELEKRRLMEIKDYTGDKNSNKTFKNTVYDEVAKNYSDIKKEDINIDYTNFGLIRNQGIWVFQTSYQLIKNESLQQKSFPIDLTIREDLLIDNKKSLNIDQVKNINGQEKDYFELVNDQYVAIQTADELLFYKIRNGYININPDFYIPFTNPTQIIMFEQGLGNYAEKWEKSFIENNNIIK